MAAKSTLQQNIEAQAASLDPAQREFVLAQFKHYRKNDERIAKLDKIIDGFSDLDVAGRDIDLENKYHRQRHQLVAEQGTLFSHIMRWLKGTAAGKSELDEFLSC